MTKGQRKMTDYVLMPEEATPEMEQAAEKYWNDRKFKALSDDPRTWKGLYAAMRAVAPAVQGELGVKWAPEEVANGNKGIRWVSDEGVHGRPTDHDCRVYLESNPNARGCHCPECIMLYAAPQPAEQQREPCHECGGNGAGGEHEEDCSQQPTPDVAQLVEALARCRHEASYSIGEVDALSIQLGKVRDIVNQTLSALAPYRKGGDAL